MDDGPALSYVNDRLDLETGYAERRALEADWFLGCAYYCGQQNLAMDQAGNILVVRDEVNQRANLLKPHVDRAVAKVNGAEFGFEAVANTTDADDRYGARVADKLFDHIMQVVDWPEKREEALGWAALAGTGFAKVTWNPDAGEKHRVYFEDDLPVMPEVLKRDPDRRRRLDQAGSYEENAEGEIQVDVLSPFHVYVDPTHRKPGLDGCSWIAQVQYMGRDRVAEMYDVSPGSLTSGRDLRSVEQFIQQFQNMVPDGSFFTNNTGSPSANGDMVRVVEFWERPLKSNGGKGRLVVIAGDRVLRNSGNPYLRFGIELPFVPIYWSKMPGRFWGISLAGQLRPPQRGYNRSRSAMQLFQEKHSWPTTWVPKGSGVSLAKLASYPGNIYTYKATHGKPITTEAPQMPPHIAQNGAAYEGEMQHISSQAPPSAGGLPGSIRSGTGIALMQQDNNASLSPTLTGAARATRDVGRMALKIAGVMYQTPRTMRVAGRSQAQMVRQFAGGDMRGNYDLRVVGEPQTADMREAYKANVMELVQIQAINPATNPVDRRRVAQAFAFKDSDPVIEGQLRAVERQELQIERILSNPEDAENIAIAHDWEDHATMAQVIEAFMHGQEYEMLPDSGKAAIFLLWKQRSDKLAAQARAQAAMAQEFAGTPGEKGTASAPRRVG